MPAPYVGEEILLHQPDGRAAPARLFGSQFEPVLVAASGQLLIRNPVTGRYEELQGTKFSTTRPHAAGFQPVASDSTRWQQRIREQAVAEQRARTPADRHAVALARRVVGDRVGLCALLDFPDSPAEIDRSEVDAYCNRSGYTGFGNRGSVRDYFEDVSGGRLHYTNIVTSYVRARHARAYYDDPSIPYTNRAQELIGEVCAALVLQGFDPAPLSADVAGNVFALNVFYAGPRAPGGGLWPHSWHLSNPVSLGPGRSIHDYQITDMPRDLTLGTFCHENGHMLCDFPDLYEKSNSLRGVGTFSLMGLGGKLGGSRSPSQVDGHHKHRAGWTNEVTSSPTGQVVLQASRSDVYIHARDERECFVIENRRRTGRDLALKDEGLAIWHVDRGGNNFKPHLAGGRYLCALVQADGLRELELLGEGRDAWGDANDLFHRGSRDSFGPGTSPSSAWNDGTPSGLSISAVSAAADTMTFRV